MNHNEIIAARPVAKNIRSQGQTYSAYVIERLVNECLRLRQGLWDAAKLCGADTNGNETPQPLASDIVEFAKQASEALRSGYEEANSDYAVLRDALRFYADEGNLWEDCEDDGEQGLSRKYITGTCHPREVAKRALAKVGERPSPGADSAGRCEQIERGEG